MKYISKATLLEARSYINNKVKKPDTFAGLMLFLFCASEINRNGKYIKSDMQSFSRLADDAFYLLEEKGVYSEKYWYALLTNDWIDQVKIYFLNDSKISLKKTLYSIFWNKSYLDIQNIISKYKSLSNISIVDDLFINDLDSKDFTESFPVKCKDLISEYKVDQDYFTIKYDNSFVKKKAGDLSGAPFAQTLYAATEIKKIISIFDFDFIEKFNLSSDLVSTSKRCLEYLHARESLSKPFLLLAGISGTGKTRFVREQAKASGDIEETYCLIPVRPDWHEPSDLIGYVSRLDSKPRYIATDVLRFIVKAWREVISSIEHDENKLPTDWCGKDLDSIRPFWLCLDEMNLAPVEQYFADYLSILETRFWNDPEKLSTSGQDYIYECDPLIKGEVFTSLDAGFAEEEDKPSTVLARDLGLNLSDDLDKDIWDYFLQHGIGIPFNLIVAGTVNMDETTHGFSRKVIDRALSFDFGEFFPNDYAEFFAPTIGNKTLSYPVLSAANHSQGQLPSIDSDGQKSIDFLNTVNAVLNNTPFELAYRALNELLLAVISAAPEDHDTLHLQAIWDDFLMCKVLPRIEGDSDKLMTDDNQLSLLQKLSVCLTTQLAEIWDAAEGADNARPDLYREKAGAEGDAKILRIACRSKAKLKWMQDRLDRSGFTSFWP